MKHLNNVSKMIPMVKKKMQGLKYFELMDRIGQNTEPVL